MRSIVVFIHIFMIYFVGMLVCAHHTELFMVRKSHNTTSSVWKQSAHMTYKQTSVVSCFRACDLFVFFWVKNKYQSTGMKWTNLMHGILDMYDMTPMSFSVYEFPSKKTTNAAKANPKYLSRYSRLTVPNLGILCCFINLTHFRFWNLGTK